MRNRLWKSRKFRSPYGFARPYLPTRIGLHLKGHPKGRGTYPVFWMKHPKRIFAPYFSDKEYWNSPADPVD